MKKEKEGKFTMKTHRLRSRVREKAGLLKLLSGLAFLFLGLLKQNNRCDFCTFFRFSDFIFRLVKNSQAKIFIVAFIE